MVFDFWLDFYLKDPLSEFSKANDTKAVSTDNVDDTDNE